jgi:phosphatidylglycerophosphate synthase
LARYRHIERPTYGFYIDHAVDAYIGILIFLGLGLSPYVRFDVACLALIAYMLLSVLVYLRTAARGEFVISYGRLGPTEVRLLAILANTLVFFIGNPQISILSIRLTVYDWMTIIVNVVLAVIAVATTLRQGKLLSDYDRRARQEKATVTKKIPLGSNIASQD